MKKSIGFLAAMALSAVASSASATVFMYTFTGTGGTTASGTLNATANGGGSYTATSGTIIDVGPISPGPGSLIPNPSAPGATTSPSVFFIYDNQAIPGQDPLLTSAGLLFMIGGNEVNIFYDLGNYELFSNNGIQGATGGAGGSFEFGTFTLTQAAVPEPATWAMMMLGFGMIGFAARNRRQQVRVTYA